jgi:hypothetical protein
MHYKIGKKGEKVVYPVEVTLDISDAPDAKFESATFCCRGSEIEWPIFESKQYGRAEFPSRPDLLTVYLTPQVSEGVNHDPDGPLEEIMGHLDIKLIYKDPESRKDRHCVTKLKFIPCAVTGCDICENAELNAHQT